MQLDRVQLRLRPRLPWEALDLGRVMVRAWAGPIYRAWFATYVPLAVVLVAISSEWGSMAIWWLKPLFDRIVLFVCSRAVFERPTTVGDVWRALPGLVRGTGLLSALTIYRLHPARSFVLPIRQLEGQSGAAARDRARVLARGALGYGMLLTGACFTISALLALSQIVLVEMFRPAGAGSFFDLELWIADEAAWHVVFLVGLFGVVAESIVEPFYVASGFSLYLNRRADLEAWDVELAFRALSARRPSGTDRPRGPVVAASVLALLLLVPAAVVHGQEPGARAATSGGTPRPASVIRDVLADPVFGEQVDALEWRRKASPESPRSVPAWLRSLLGAIEAIARSARVIVWIVGACALGVVLWWLAGHRAWRRDHEAGPVPDMVFGVDVRPASLPRDIAGTVRRLVAEGRVTDALSLLYRGTLVALIHRAGVVFQEGDTEDDCLGRARPVLGASALSVLASVLDAWRQAAYAQRPPAGAEVLALADRWTQHFAAVERRS